MIVRKLALVAAGVTATLAATAGPAVAAPTAYRVVDLGVLPGATYSSAAAMNERLNSMGYHSAREFNQNIIKWIEAGTAQTSYYGNDDSY